MGTVTDYLEKRHIEFSTLEHRRSFTSSDEARVLGADADRIAKTIVLDTDSGHAIAVIPASRRLDKQLLEDAVGPHTKLASEDELRRDFPDFELGAIPPLGSLLSVPAYVDPELGIQPNVIFAAGTQTQSIEIRSNDLLSDPNTKVARLTSERSLDEDWME